jgi:hypothetical protein
MAPTPEPIPAGTIALVMRGLDPTSDTDHATMRELAKSTGLTIVALLDGQELEAVSEDEMGRAGWCRCPRPGFPIVPLFPDHPDSLEEQAEAGGVPPII